jgi:hypothetical protein
LATAFPVSAKRSMQIEYYGDTLTLNIDSFESIKYPAHFVSEQLIKDFYQKARNLHYRPLVNHLLYYKEKNKLDDWFYYQLIRKTAEQLCSKKVNFELYTLYKWFLLSYSGYDAQLAICENKLLFYVRCDENIYDIPFYKKDNKQYVCLNYHDYGSQIDFKTKIFFPVDIKIQEGINHFSYRVNKIPEFNNEIYIEKDLSFKYESKNYEFNLQINPEIKNIFFNYPVVDYEAYFNIPISKGTYNSLIPTLRSIVKDMTQEKGVDYLMRFTRSAFAYKNDQINFGKEKRMSPEMTLLYNESDCDDRAALFFSLVKEIYKIPMIILVYPKHVTIAVEFAKAKGKPIIYNNKKYYICEPTPQSEDLSIGQTNRNYRKTPYEIAYEYKPEAH